MNGLTIVKVERDPLELVRDGVPEVILDVHEVLPAPHRFPNFIVNFEFNGVPGTMAMALELEGRDADWNDPEGIGVDFDAMPDLSAEIMNAIYGSKPYADAQKSLEEAPPSFWK